MEKKIKWIRFNNHLYIIKGKGKSIIKGEIENINLKKMLQGSCPH